MTRRRSRPTSNSSRSNIRRTCRPARSARPPMRSEAAMRVNKRLAAGLLATLLGSAAVAAPAPDIAKMKQDAFAVVDQHADRMGRLSDAIFSYSEIGFQEVKTIA